MTNATRKISEFDVSAIGLGAMNLSHAYGVPPSPKHSVHLLNEAIDVGYTMIDTAALYGFGTNETLVGEALRRRRYDYMLTSKCGLHGVDGKRELTNDPAKLKQSCEDSLRRLRTESIDLFYLHRWDKITPIEESIGALSTLVTEGKIRAIGLSEVSATTLRCAHAVHPISALQSEYSLWTREPEIAVLDACRDLGVTFVAFSPLARGYLTGKLRDIAALHAKDFRRNMPRFLPENYSLNLKLLDAFRDLAKQHDCTMSQMALAWLLHVDDNIVPIPGTTDLQHLRENIAALDVTLDGATVAAADKLINQHNVIGPRYIPKTQAEIDTEAFD